MNENSICNCCYNKNDLIKKCNFEHHQICTDCNKEYTLRFRRRNCMFCDPHEEKYKINMGGIYNTRLSDNELYFILFCNIFLTIVIITLLFFLTIFIVNILTSLKDVILLNIYNNLNNIKLNELFECNL